MQQTLSPSMKGFFLALLTAVMWGLLPVVLKVLLVNMDAYTITAVRFVFAGVFVFALLYWQKGLPRWQQGKRTVWIILFVSTILLLVNYVTNVIALEFISPATVQLILQIAPFLLILGGVVVYKESFSQLQTFGVVTLFIGLGLFFNQRIPVIMDSEQESIEGVIIVVFSAAAWALYALAQKHLLVSFTSQQLTFLIYLLGSALLIPLSEFAILGMLTNGQWVALVFCCLNTLIGYGAFTKAMQIWEASKVSAVISIAPIVTYFSNKVAIIVAPEVFYDAELDLLAYIGAIAIIAGAMMASIGKRNAANTKQ